jgi:hypothetical protein
MHRDLKVDIQSAAKDIKESTAKNIEGVKSDLHSVALGRTSVISNTETRAERVKTLRTTDHLLPSRDFTSTLDNAKVSWWPVGGKTKFPSANCPEKSVCQTFVSEMLSLFINGTVEVTERDGKKKVVKVHSVPDPDAFRTRQVNNRAPYCLFHDGVDKRGNFTVTLEGEVKGGGNGIFSDDKIGQVTDGLQRFLESQTERAEMIGFVTDGRRFQFIRIHKQSRGTGYHFDISSIYLEYLGWQVS